MKQGQREVSPLSREGMPSVGGLTLYPPDYRAAFACSLLPFPLPRGLLLRVAVPPPWSGGEEDNGLTSFIGKIAEGKVVPLDRWHIIRARGTLKPLVLATYLFGSGLSAPLAC